MKLGLQGQVALITGGSSGIGLAAAGRLRAEGCTVVVCGRDEARLERALVQLASVDSAGRVQAICADAHTAEGCDELLGAGRRLGKMTVLVTAAEGPQPETSERQVADDGAWADALSGKLSGVIRLTHAFAEAVSGEPARIVHVLGTTAFRTREGLARSGVVNAALANFIQSASVYLGRKQVGILGVHPGYIDTPRTQRFIATRGESAARVAEELAAASPLRRLGQPDEVGDLITFLASPRASFITGTTVSIDGGASIASGRA
jgi:NAD(P)-dependent dehydrogenase (short-subunit alcohol dehydrogenase family)